MHCHQPLIKWLRTHCFSGQMTPSAATQQTPLKSKTIISNHEAVDALKKRADKLAHPLP